MIRQLTSATSQVVELTANGAHALRIGPRTVSRQRRAWASREELRVLASSGLFEAEWYADQYPEYARSGRSADEHFRLHGLWEERAPGPLFSPEYYRSSNRHIDGATPALLWYLQRGSQDRVSPTPLFDEQWYRNEYGALLQPGEIALLHYLRQPLTAGYWPNPLFDTVWFAATYADVIPAGTHPLAFYARIGPAEILQPCRLFDPVWYLRRNPEIRGLHPLAHFLEHGAKHVLSPHPLIDLRYFGAAVRA